jgi:hypothetical protein
VVSEVRSPRRRRSVAVAPALLDPAELPEDAAGRVKVISVAAPDDVLDALAATEPSVSAPPFPSIIAAGGGWFAVGIAGVLIVIIFVVGVLLTR